MDGDHTDGPRRCGAEGASKIVSQAHGRGAKRCGKQFRRDDAETGEVAGAKEGRHRRMGERWVDARRTVDALTRSLLVNTVLGYPNLFPPCHGRGFVVGIASL